MFPKPWEMFNQRNDKHSKEPSVENTGLWALAIINYNCTKLQFVRALSLLCEKHGRNHRTVAVKTAVKTDVPSDLFQWPF